MIQAIIIEDEDFAAERLKMLLQDTGETVEVIAVLNSIQQAVQWLLMNKTDLIFLDINLADGNAFKIFERVEIRTPIIFTTAYHEYALRAFEQHSIDYLLKPISREKLKNSLDKLKSLKQSDSPSNHLEELKELVNTLGVQKASKKFMVTIGNKVKVIDSTEAAYFVTDSGATFLYTFDGKRYSIDFSLKQLQHSLPIQDFYRVNRQYLLNRASIQELQYYSPTYVKVNINPAPKNEVVVAREKIGLFKKWLVE